MLFPLQQSITFMISLRWGDQTQFLSSIAKVSCGIWACHYIQTDGIWLIFSAIFKVFLCFGRLLLKCWKSCNFHAFPTAGKPHFYDFIALRGPNPVSFVHCQGFLRNLSMSLHTNRWHMAYFLCNFQGFPLLWAASAKLLKKSQFPSFQWVSLQFSCSYSALGRSIWDNCWKSCNFDAFPTAGKPHFYDFIALRGPNPVSFVHCQGFLRNLSMSLHTNRWHMAYFLCNFQGFPLLWAASAISFLSMGFSAILSFPLLWAASAKNAEKVVLSRFPSDSEHVTNKSKWHMAYFLCNVQGFPLLWTASAKLLKKS